MRAAYPHCATRSRTKCPDVRRRVISALADIGDARALETLTQALKDEDASVRRSAASAIADIAGGGPHPHPHPHPRPRPRPMLDSNLNINPDLHMHLQMQRVVVR
jgi:HEAT repeat protein